MTVMLWTKSRPLCTLGKLYQLNHMCNSGAVFQSENVADIFIKLFWDVLLVAVVVWWAGIEPRTLCRLDKHPTTVLQKQQEAQSV